MWTNVQLPTSTGSTAESVTCLSGSPRYTLHSANERYNLIQLENFNTTKVPSWKNEEILIKP